MFIECFNNKYVLSENLTVFNVTTGVEETIHKMKDGKHFFIARGDGEVKKIKLGLFKMYQLGLFNLPVKLWDLVDFGFLDEESQEYTAENLYVIYPKEGIRYPGMPGYYYIPGFELNAIDKTGRVYRSIRKSIYEPYMGGKVIADSFYPFTRLDGLEGDERKYVHRLLAITFKDPPAKYPLLLVDHHNGNKLDFSLDNLMWVTVNENNVKAYRQNLKWDNIPIVVKDIKLETVTQYISKAEFAREIQVDPWCIGLAMQRSRSVYKNRYIIKEVEDPRDFDEIFNEPIEQVKGIKARNVFTGEITHYSGLSETCRKTGVGTSNVRASLTGKNPRSIFKDLQFKRESDETPWPDLNEYELECYRRGLHPDTPVYEMFDAFTHEVSIHYGWKSINELTGANPRTISFCARDNKILHRRYKLKKVSR